MEKFPNLQKTKSAELYGVIDATQFYRFVTGTAQVWQWASDEPKSLQLSWGRAQIWDGGTPQLPPKHDSSVPTLLWALFTTTLFDLPKMLILGWN